MDRLTSIKVFRQVVESGSFVRAAERLDLSTAMVSKHVKALENRLRVRLLNRNSHRLCLTQPGKFYFERCKDILRELQETELELESLNSTPRGTLRIAFCDRCIPGLGLAGVLAEYRRRWPEVVLDISYVDRPVNLVDDSYDLAFRIVSEDRLPPEIVARRVRPVPFRLVASQAYLERNGIPKAPADLVRHDFVTAGDLESLWLEGAKGTIEIPLRVALRCRTLADVAITVAGGMGMALLPAALCSDPAFAAGLRSVLTEFQLKESTLYLLHPGRKHLSFKARAFTDLVLESGARTREQPQADSAANPLRQPQRKVSADAPEKRHDRSPPSLAPRQVHPSEFPVPRPSAIEGAWSAA